MNDGFWRMWKEVVYLLNVSWHLPGGTESKHKEPQSEFCDTLES
jgi:hypothetical protein